jgi:hypothetical protein
MAERKSTAWKWLVVALSLGYVLNPSGMSPTMVDAIDWAVRHWWLFAGLAVMLGFGHLTERRRLAQALDTEELRERRRLARALNNEEPRNANQR